MTALLNIWYVQLNKNRVCEMIDRRIHEDSPKFDDMHKNRAKDYNLQAHISIKAHTEKIHYVHLQVAM